VKRTPAEIAAEFCEKTYGPFIAALESCCTAEDKEVTDYSLVHGLLSAHLQACRRELEASIEKGRVTFDEAAADACYAAYADSYGPGKCSNVSVTDILPDPSGTACRSVFVGVGAAGAPCMGDHECVDGLTCVGYTSDSDGSCKAPPAVGEPCGPPPDEGQDPSQVAFGNHPRCVSGARCDSFIGECVKAPAEGESCNAASLINECAPPLECVNGKCASARVPEGGTCGKDSDCASGYYCERSSGASKCMKKKTAGSSCEGGPFELECFGRCDAPLGREGQCKSVCGSL